MTSEPLIARAATAATPASALERRLLALATSVLLNVILLASGAIASVVAARSTHRQYLPLEPLQVMAVGLVLAHLSVGAILWARTGGSIHARTTIAALGTLGMWGLLLLVLDQTRASGVAAAAWAVAFTLQVVLTAAAATAIEFVVDPRVAAGHSRFTIGFLLSWTALLAIVLGAAGRGAAQHGWKLADVTAWQYFYQLQLTALLSTALAVAISGSLRLISSRTVRIAACTMSILAAGAVSPLLFHCLFGEDVGAAPVEIAWLFVSQSLFLVASLAPQASLRPAASQAYQSAVTS